jgi:hypothetical protein
MACIFSVEPGISTVLVDSSVTPITFSLGGWNIGLNSGFVSRRAMVQSISMSTQGSQQYMNTLRRYYFVYPFGERPGKIVISGYTVMGYCWVDNAGTIQFNQTGSGISGVINYYDNYAFSSTSLPVGITVGAYSFSAFLTGAKVEVINPEGRIGQFALEFDSFR